MYAGVLDMPFAEYLALDAWGSGSLRAMRRGPPARVLWERTAERPETDATILGTAVHCALLTPDLYEQQYAIKPEGMSFASKEGKAWRDDPVRAGRTLLSADVGAKVEAIVDALLNKQGVAASLDNATAREGTLLWDCSVTGEACKARPDWMAGKYIYDLKVSRHAGSGYLALRTFSEGWQHQLAHYRTGAIELGLPIIGGRLVVVDPAPPHFVYTLEVKQDALDLLEIENIQTLKMLRECRVSNKWPSTPDQWVKVEPPATANMDAMNDVALIDDAEQTEEVA
jgi:exodeoxyribonuclease VIII